MGKGRKKRSVPKPAPSLLERVDGLQLKVTSEDSHGYHQQEQVNLHGTLPYNAQNTNSIVTEAAPFASMQKKPSLDGEIRPKRASSIPCRFFERGYCRNGDYCRFQHSEAASATAKPFHSAAKVPPANTHANNPSVKGRAPSEKNCPPGMCLDWHLTGSCPRYRTCRYAHLFNCDADGFGKNTESGMHKDSGIGLGGFEYMAAQLLECGLSGSRGSGEMSERMRNCGFTDDDVYELSLQGIKPWDPEAWDALGVLNGWDMDDLYDSDDCGF